MENLELKSQNYRGYRYATECLCTHCSNSNGYGPFWFPRVLAWLNGRGGICCPRCHRLVRTRPRQNECRRRFRSWFREGKR
jgi:hypothetical protein